jgi:hypothetical protein
MLSSNIATIAYVETRGAELRRAAIQARLVKTATRRSRMNAIGRSPRV